MTEEYKREKIRELTVLENDVNTCTYDMEKFIEQIWQDGYNAGSEWDIVRIGAADRGKYDS